MASPGASRGYRTLCAIGRGSFGEALLVRDPEGIVRVSKVVNVGRMSKQEQEEAANEVNVFASLRHPYIIRFRESFVEDGTLAIVMDFAEGGDLYHRIRTAREADNTFSQNQVLKWFTESVLGTKYLHSLRLVHRDLKSENCFLTREGTLVLGDFGLSRRLPKEDDFFRDARAVVGTPHYLAPEIFSEALYSFASDVWSLGCVLFEMVALRVPFQAHTVAAISVKVVQGQFPTMPAAYSPKVAKLFLECLCLDHHGRPSAAEILRRPIIQQEAKRMLKQVKARCSHSAGAAPSGRSMRGKPVMNVTPSADDKANVPSESRSVSVGAADDGIAALGDAAVEVTLPGYPGRSSEEDGKEVSRLVLTGSENAVTLKLSELTVSASTRMDEKVWNWSSTLDPRDTSASTGNANAIASIGPRLEAAGDLLQPQEFELTSPLEAAAAAASEAMAASKTPLAQASAVNAVPIPAAVPRGPAAALPLTADAFVQADLGPSHAEAATDNVSPASGCAPSSSDSNPSSTTPTGPGNAHQSQARPAACPRLDLHSQRARGPNPTSESRRSSSGSRVTRSRTVSRLNSDILRAQEHLERQASPPAAAAGPVHPKPPKLWLPAGPGRAWEEAWPSVRDHSTPRGCTPRACTPRSCTPRSYTPRAPGRLQKSKSAAALKENVDPHQPALRSKRHQTRRLSKNEEVPPIKNPTLGSADTRVTSARGGGSARGMSRNGSAPSVTCVVEQSPQDVLLRGKRLPIPTGGLHTDGGPLSLRERGGRAASTTVVAPRSSRPRAAGGGAVGELRRIVSAGGLERRKPS